MYLLLKTKLTYIIAFKTFFNITLYNTLLHSTPYLLFIIKNEQKKPNLIYCYLLLKTNKTKSNPQVAKCMFLLNPETKLFYRF